MTKPKMANISARIPEDERNLFNTQVESMGWKNSTRFMNCVIDLVVEGKLSIQAPPAYVPKVSFKE